MKEINHKEKEWSKELPNKRSYEYKHSGSYTRYALAQLFGAKPLEIPLNSPPGSPPLLKKGWGYLSISHCKDLLLIGWSPDNIGVDIERSDRKFSVQQLGNRLLNKKKHKELDSLNQAEKHNTVLKNWVVKEASLKWHKGSLLKDLFIWEWDENTNKSHHKLKGYEIDIDIFEYQSWIIGIAFNKTIHSSKNIICTNLNET